MAEESKKEPEDSASSVDTEIKKTKKKKGVLSKVWNALFGARGDDFEKRLQHISKEEATVLARIARRSHSWRRMTRHLIVLSILCEVIAVGYAVMTTRSITLNWKTRAWRVLPMFLLPVLFFVTYSILRSLSKMRDQKDHKNLESLRAERQAKIDELKEKTNYYITQQLIQRYDPDPAAKAAAATVLASKLGADSGLRVYLGDDVNPNVSAGKSNDVEVAKATGLRNRKQPLARSTSMDSGSLIHNHPDQANSGVTGADPAQQHPLVVEHHPQTGSTLNDGGWIARLAALLVGEDPTQSYALICGNCHMHNGLARKEDFPYVTYYCPHCQALNRPKQTDGHVSGSVSPAMPLREDVAEDPILSHSSEDRVPSSSSDEASAHADGILEG